MLCKLVEKKLKKGKTIAQIAEELEESESVIKKILEDKRENWARVTYYRNKEKLIKEVTR